ncbi:MAG: hypothetical protein CMO00_02440 [Synechococcus sp. SAT82]|nr:hypothetical protein [Synechococcus sp. SAT82]|tara:strand:- start:616 stop:885 length:270 start_codon:yes stop_codon:yes gene_type:complete
MAAIQDQNYVKLCAQLATRLSISLASARRRVDQAAAREGRRDVEGRRAMAQSLLDALDNDTDESNADNPERLNSLLSVSEGDGNFIIED